MALSAGERVAIESRIGPIGLDPVSEAGNLEELIVLLGGSSVAALHVLRVRYAEFVSSPAVVSAQGDGSVSHVANIAPMLSSIGALVVEIENDPDLVLTEAGEKLVEAGRALSSPGGGWESVPVIARNSRPG